ncbi:hypothetical protein BHE74_00019835 [Ensete ventricosum]|nr:hypothetical protein BHE74_00019835 [Ensete ventricosum]
MDVRFTLGTTRHGPEEEAECLRLHVPGKRGTTTCHDAFDPFLPACLALPCRAGGCASEHSNEYKEHDDENLLCLAHKAKRKAFGSFPHALAEFLQLQTRAATRSSIGVHLCVFSRARPELLWREGRENPSRPVPATSMDGEIHRYQSLYRIWSLVWTYLKEISPRAYDERSKKNLWPSAVQVVKCLPLPVSIAETVDGFLTVAFCALQVNRIKSILHGRHFKGAQGTKFDAIQQEKKVVFVNKEQGIRTIHDLSLYNSCTTSSYSCY